MFCGQGLTEGRIRTRLYYIPNGNDYHIAELFKETFTEVKPFGCHDVQEYIDLRILAHKTPHASEIMYREVLSMKPDIVYVESGYNIKPSALQKVRTRLKIPVVQWFGDACVNERFIKRILTYAKSVDRQVVVDTRAVEEGKKKNLQNIEFIPFFGYDHYFRPLSVEKTIDILFSGKSYHKSLRTYPFAKERLAFITRVNREFGAGLKVVGEGWEGYGLVNYEGWRVPEWEINTFNNMSRIVLAYDAVQIQDFTSCRIFNALLGKSFVITRKYPGIERSFTNCEHLVWFEDQEEGLALIRSYLNDPAGRERIAQNGYNLVHHNGWKFSNVARYLVNRGLKREARLFEDIYTPHSQKLPQIISPGIASSQETCSASDRKKVSAIVSTYNSERFIRGCLEDLVNQTIYKNGGQEIIVLDSASEQDEKTIVEEFQKQYDNIVYIRTEKREGVYAAWNRGVRAATGQYITNANTDDRHRRDAFEIMARTLDQNPQIGLVYADVILTRTENETFEKHTSARTYHCPQYDREHLVTTCYIGPHPMWRKSIHDWYGYFDKSFVVSGDWEFWLRIAEDTGFLHIPDRLGLYLINPDSIEHKNAGHKKREDKKIQEKYMRQYFPNPIVLTIKKMGIKITRAKIFAREIYRSISKSLRMF